MMEVRPCWLWSEDDSEEPSAPPSCCCCCCCCCSCSCALCFASSWRMAWREAWWSTLRKKYSSSSWSAEHSMPVIMGTKPWQRTFCARMLAFSSLAEKQRVTGMPDCTASSFDSGRRSITRSLICGYMLRSITAVKMFCPSASSGYSLFTSEIKKVKVEVPTCARSRSAFELTLPTRNQTRRRAAGGRSRARRKSLKLPPCSSPFAPVPTSSQFVGEKITTLGQVLLLPCFLTRFRHMQHQLQGASQPPAEESWQECRISCRKPATMVESFEAAPLRQRTTTTCFSCLDLGV
mmetsp:Transcript_63398/g.175735  ORF Transcript_63398/g.175735 Transcript_63398/m.175735 type:complete len:292 (+) Transcript_63398:1725-2600(+)